MKKKMGQLTLRTNKEEMNECINTLIAFVGDANGSRSKVLRKIGQIVVRSWVLVVHKPKRWRRGIGGKISIIVRWLVAVIRVDLVPSTGVKVVWAVAGVGVEVAQIVITAHCTIIVDETTIERGIESSHGTAASATTQHAFSVIRGSIDDRFNFRVELDSGIRERLNEEEKKRGEK